MMSVSLSAKLRGGKVFEGNFSATSLFMRSRVAFPNPLLMYMLSSLISFLENWLRLKL